MKKFLQRTFYCIIFSALSLSIYAQEVPQNTSITNGYIDAAVHNFKSFDVASSNCFNLVTHGRPGQLYINGNWLSKEEIVSFLKPRILPSVVQLNIFGCEFAKGTIGFRSVAYLQQELGIFVSASDDVTGAGGDWLLEVGQQKYIAGYEDYPYSLQCNGTGTDSDGDGVHDGIDVDDDNDGISDTEECGGFPDGRNFSAPLGVARPWTGPSTSSNVTVLATFNEGEFIPHTAERTVIRPPYLIGNSRTAATVTRGFKLGYNGFSYLYSPDGIGGTGVLTLNIRFDNPVPASEIAFQIGDVDDNRAPGGNPECRITVNGSADISNHFEQAYFNRMPSQTPPGGENYGTVNLSTGVVDFNITGADQSLKTVLRGVSDRTVSSIEVTFRRFSDRIGFDIFAIIPSCNDADGDGTGNDRDKDSDGDGIPDVYEFCSADRASINRTSCTLPPSSARDSEGCNLGAATSSCTRGRDTDGDGTPDFLDLDSDGDGCSDANESAGTGSCTPPRDNEYLDKCITKCLTDTDGDDVPDITDVDDDNDGISDNDEKNCASTILFHNNTETLDGTSGRLAVGNASYSIETSGGSSFGAYSAFSTDLNWAVLRAVSSTASPNPDPPTGTRERPAKARYSFTQPIYDLDFKVFHITKIDQIPDQPEEIRVTAYNNGRVVGSTAIVGDSVALVPGTNWYKSIATGTPPPGEANEDKYAVKFRFLGPIDALVIEEHANQSTLVNGAVTEFNKGCIAKDSDGDNVPDHLDLDSDNDGIPDAHEGCGNISATLTDCRLAPDENRDANRDGCKDGFTTRPCSPVRDTDSDGIPDYLDLDSDADVCSDAIESGKQPTNGAPNANGTVNNCNPVTINDHLNKCVAECLTDTDGDGVPDMTDVDDDNDGIADVDEKNCALPILLHENTETLDGSSGPLAAGDAYHSIETSGGTSFRAYSAFPANLNQAILRAEYSTASPNPNPPTGTRQRPAMARYGFSKPIYDLDFKAFHITTPDQAPDQPEEVRVTGYLNGRVVRSRTIVGDSVGLVPGTNWYRSIAKGIAPGADVNGDRYAVKFRFVGPIDSLIIEEHVNQSDQINGIAFEFNGGCIAKDTDRDNVPDHIDLDSDNDGIPDAHEGCGNISATLTNCRLDPDDNRDADRDGCNDGFTTTPCSPVLDTDSDGAPDYLDLDSDGDGCSDANESGKEPTNGSPNATNGTVNNCDPVTENEHLSKCVARCQTDSDNDGAYDIIDPDDDNDGISDVVEIGNTTRTIAINASTLSNESNRTDPLVFEPNVPQSFRNVAGMQGLNMTLEMDGFNIFKAAQHPPEFRSMPDGDAIYAEIPGGNLAGYFGAAINKRNRANFINWDVRFDGSVLPTKVTVFSQNRLYSSDGESRGDRNRLGEAIAINTDFIGDWTNPVTDLGRGQANGFFVRGSGTLSNSYISKFPPPGDNVGAAGFRSEWLARAAGSGYLRNIGVNYYYSGYRSGGDPPNSVQSFGIEFIVYVPKDTDGDGVPDYLDGDSDNDGVPDANEGCGRITSYTDCRIPINTTANPTNSNNCAGAGATVSPCDSPIDTDNDGIPDYLDLDSDNDGCADAIETGKGDYNVNKRVPGNLYSAPAVTSSGLTNAPCLSPENNRWIDSTDKTACNIEPINDINQTPKNKRVVGNVLTNDPDYTKGSVVLSAKVDTNGDGIGDTQITLGSPHIFPGGVGQITLNRNGSYVFTPDSLFKGQVPVIDYKMMDRMTNEGYARIDIDVIPTDVLNRHDPPTGNDDTGQTDRRVSVSGDVLQNDTDTDSPHQALKVTGVSVLGSDGRTAVSGLPGNSIVAYDTLGNTAGQITIAANGKYTFAPVSGFKGEVLVKYNLADEYNLASNGLLTITVYNEDSTAPKNNTYVNDDANSGLKNVSQNGNILSNDTDPEGNRQSVSLTDHNGDGVFDPFRSGSPIALSRGGSVVINADGSYIYKPLRGLVGTEVLSYVACDDASTGACDTATLYLTTLPDVHALNDINYTLKGIPVSGNLLDNDDNKNGERIISIKVDTNGDDIGDYPVAIGGAAPIIDHRGRFVGRIKIDSDGAYTFTPDSAFTGQVPKIDYVIRDADGAMDGATLDIDVQGPEKFGEPSPPVANDDTGETDQGVPISGTILLNDNDPDSPKDLLKVATSKGLDRDGISINIPLNTPTVIYDIARKRAGTIVINPDGKYTFTPDSSYTGHVSIKYTVVDETRLSDDAILTISVNPENPLSPVNNTYANDDANSGPKGYPMKGAIIANDSDPERNNQRVTRATTSNGRTITPGTPVRLPSQGTLLINEDGRYTYVPAPEFVGTEAVFYTVCDDDPDQACDSATLYLTTTPDVNAINDINQTAKRIPVNGNLLTNDDNKNGERVTSAKVDTDGDGVADKEVPTGIATSINGRGGSPVGSITINRDGTYTFAPDSSFTGQVPIIEYVITDADGAKDAATLDIDVIPTPEPNKPNAPVANDDTGKTDQGVPVSGIITINDTDPSAPKGELIVTKITGIGEDGKPKNIPVNTPTRIYDTTGKPVGDIVIDSTGKYTFTPTPTFIGDVPPINYTVTDPSGHSDSAKLAIFVTPEDSLNPVNNTYANDDANSGPKGYPMKGAVIANDSDPEENIQTIARGTTSNGTPITPGVPTKLPSNGTLRIEEDGTYTYVPSLGFVGTEIVTYTVCDDDPDQACTSATLYLTTFPDVNAVDDINQTTKGVPVGGNLLTNDDNRNGERVTSVKIDTNGDDVVDRDLPIGVVTPISDRRGNPVGSIIINPDGTYTFTPDSSFAGQVPIIEYVITDANGSKDAATLDIDVIPVLQPNTPDVPVANDDTGKTDQGVPVSGIVTINDNDPNTPKEELIVTKVTGIGEDGKPKNIPVNTPTRIYDTTGKPVGDIVIDRTGKYTFTPTPTFAGDVPPIKYIVTDPQGGIDSAKLTIRVTPENPLSPVNNTYANDDANSGPKDNLMKGSVIINDSDPEGHSQRITGATTSNGTSVISGTSVKLPSNGTLLLNGDGTYTYVPRLGFVGTEVVTYRVCDNDSAQACDSATLYLTTLPNVKALNDINQTTKGVPVKGNLLTNDDNENGERVTSAKVDTNGDGVADKDLPIGATTSISDKDGKPVGSIIVNRDGTYTFAPDTSFAGQVPLIEYVITDANGAKGAATLDIDVMPAPEPNKPDAPVANDDTGKTDQGVPVSGIVTINDNNPNLPKEELVVTKITGIGEDGKPKNIPVNTPTRIYDTTGKPVGDIVIDSVGKYTFTPTPTFTGDVPIKYTVTDPRGGIDSAKLTIRVTPESPLSPVNNTYANDDASSGPKGNPLRGMLIANDSDPEGNSQKVTRAITSDGTSITPGTSVNLPSGGTLLINEDGSYVYVPRPGFVGTEIVTYTICDNDTTQACDRATLYLTTLPDVNAINDINQTVKGIPVNGNLLTNDENKNGERVTSAKVDTNGDGIADKDLPIGVVTSITDKDGKPVGSITVNRNGIYTFVPDTSFAGQVPIIEYLITDADGAKDVASLDIDVMPAPEPNKPDAPVANDDTGKTDQGKPVKGTLVTNDGDPDTPKDKLKVTKVTGIGENGKPKNIPVNTPTKIYDITGKPVGDIVVDSTGKYTFTPTPTFTGDIPIKYTVTDPDGRSDSAKLTITVVPEDSLNPVNNTYANDDANSGMAGTMQEGNVLTNDTDPEGHDYQVTGGTTFEGAVITPDVAIELLSGGSLLMAKDGSYTYTPAPGFIGTEIVVYTKCDMATPSSCDVANLYLTTYTNTGDTIPPVIQKCADSVRMMLPASSCGATVPDFRGAVEATDSLTPADRLIFAQNPRAGSQVGVGVHDITVTVSDLSGNRATCKAILIVSDTMPPSIICPADTTVSTGTDCRATIDVPKLTVADTCDLATLTWEMSGATVRASSAIGINYLMGNTVFNAGETRVVYTATDSSGNKSMCSFNVKADNGMALAANFKTACYGATTTLTVTVNGSDKGQYIYQLDNGRRQGSNTFAVSAGLHTVKVINVNGCESLMQVNVAEHRGIVLSPDTRATIDNCIDSKGSIRMVVEGGVAPYMYRLAGGAYQSQGVFTGLDGGNYIVEALDANGCSKEFSISVTSPSNINVKTFEATPISAGCGGGESNGTVNVVADFAGGIGSLSYSYQWYNALNSDVVIAETKDLSNVAPGRYILVVAVKDDASACVSHFTLITEVGKSNTTVSGAITSRDTTLTDSAVTAKVIMTGMGGQAPYTFTYRVNGEQVDTITGSPDGVLMHPPTLPGNYLYQFITVTDALGCTAVIDTVIFVSVPDRNVASRPDLTPLLTILPAIAHKRSGMMGLIDIDEINGQATSGLISVFLTKDEKIEVYFNKDATSISGFPVDNSVWDFDPTVSGYYKFTTTEVIPANGKLRIGYEFTLTPGERNGKLTVTATILFPSGNEAEVVNNVDAEIIAYFYN